MIDKLFYFSLLEDLDPFERVVHSEEWWYYQNPYYKHHTISWSFLYVSFWYSKKL